MKNTLKYAAISLLLLCSAAGLAQDKSASKYPMVGDTIADHTFTDVINYPYTKAKISDFRGKWLILDFWGYTCSACIYSFPKMDSLARQFKGKDVQLIMVGSTKSWSKADVKKEETVTKKLYNRLEKLYQLKFTVAFDSVLYLKHDVGGLPQIFVIDPKGIIRAKTTHIDSTQIAELLSGKSPSFERSFSRTEPAGIDTYNLHIPLLTNNGANANGGRDTSYIYRSLLLPQDRSTMPTYNTADLYRLHKRYPSKPIRLELFDHPLYHLYHLAYFGRSDWSNIDSAMYNTYSDIIVNETGNAELPKFLKKRYAYSLSMPVTDSVTAIMRTIQEDLRRVFPYSARVEVRNMPVYEVTVANDAKLKKLLKPQANGEMSNSDSYDGVWKVKNIEFSDFMKRMIFSMYSNIPVINRTGNEGKFLDVDFQSDLLTMESILSGLEKMGLKLEKHERPMKVIVLSK